MVLWLRNSACPLDQGRQCRHTCGLPRAQELNKEGLEEPEIDGVGGNGWYLECGRIGEPECIGMGVQVWGPKGGANVSTGEGSTESGVTGTPLLPA